MSYEAALEAFGHRKILEQMGDIKYRNLAVETEMTQATHDTYWGDEAGTIDVYVTFNYTHTVKPRKGSGAIKEKEANGWLPFHYDSPIEFLRELLGE